MEALEVTRHAKVGAVAGVFLAVVVYGFFVVIPQSTAQRAALYLVLAFVVAVSTTLLVTVGLTVRRVARMTMDPPKWIRRGGTAAAVGGTVWAGLAALVPLSGSAGSAPAYAPVLLVAPLSVLGGVWAVHAAYRRRYGTHGLVGAVVSGAGLVLVGWVGVIDPQGFVVGRLTSVEPAVFLGANLLALLGTTVHGSALLRARAVPTAAALAMLFALPAGLAGLTVLAYAGAGDLAFLALGVPVGVAWVGIGVALRNGRGVPPLEAFDPGLDSLDG